MVNHLLFTIYYVNYYDNHDKKMLVIVPTTSLVEQLYKDFYEYGFDVDNEVHRIYSGKDKVTDKRIIISTWHLSIDLSLIGSNSLVQSLVMKCIYLKQNH